VNDIQGDKLAYEVTYPVSTYVWCKGSSSQSGRHPIFVSSPVKFTTKGDKHFFFLNCTDVTCSLYARATGYEEAEIGFQTGYVRRPAC
jgi:hypothetical protein